jgi:hypothetical protein
VSRLRGELEAARRIIAAAVNSNAELGEIEVAVLSDLVADVRVLAKRAGRDIAKRRLLARPDSHADKLAKRGEWLGHFQ